ncbi:MAG: chemotaxis protein CheA [Methanosarcinaceae archaeon]|nr:chemotaxis protein CheA [Methanosarcinaceae archaeon]
MDMSKYMVIFKAESEKNIKLFSDSLLALERAPENMEHINTMFRAAHTFKGMAATMGFQQIAEFTHEIENLMDILRTRKLRLDESITDILFESLDMLEVLVESIEEDQTREKSSQVSGDIARVLENLKAINTTKNRPEGIEKEQREKEKGKIREEKSESTGKKENEEIISQKQSNSVTGLEFTEKEKIAIKTAEEDGEKVMISRITLKENCIFKAARSAMVIQRVSEDGNLIKTIPSLNELEEENFDLDFTVIFSTKKDRNIIKNKINKIAEIKEISIIILERKLEKTTSSEQEKNKTPPAKEENAEEENAEEKNAEEENAEEKNAEEKNAEEENVAKKIIEEKEINQETGKKIENSHLLKSNPHIPETNNKIKTVKNVKISIEKLDKLMNLASELVIKESRINQLTRGQKDKELIKALSDLNKLTREIQEKVIEARMVPLDQIFNLFPRMIRDLARKENKKIDFIIKGKEIELDRTVLDEIGDPLIHLLRNSVDHGIEGTQKRIESGKRETGTIELTASRRENHVLIWIEDDGQGIDSQKLRKTAVKKGMISQEEGEKLSDWEAVQLIFTPGFSTAKEITDISGRGVGMDVVKNRIEAIGGNIKIKSCPGKGTIFELKLPLTVALVQVLLVEIGNEVYAIPFNNIVKNIEINKTEIKSVRGEEVILRDEQVIPLLRPHSLFKIPIPEKEKLSIVIVEKAEKYTGIVVDKLLGKKEVVIKTINCKLLQGTKGFAGATILGDGNVVPILEIHSLI